RLETQALRDQLQQRQPGPQSSQGRTGSQFDVPSAALVLKPQSFDGTFSWEAYKVQFETVAEANGWNIPTKARALISYLRGKAVEVLENIPGELRHDYPTLVAALDARFGDSHLEQLHYAELRARRQQSGETLPELAASIERLTRKSFPGTSADTVNVVSTASFMDAIGDVKIQQIVRLGSPSTLRAALVQAVETEAAVRCTERSVLHPNFGSSLNRRGSTRPMNCFRCGALGHIASQCRADLPETHQGNDSAGHRGRARW
ncbi:unnamed protein product, partial [Ixodes hexagonus]